MSQFSIEEKLDELLASDFETEITEFKEAKNDFSFEELGRYFSAKTDENCPETTQKTTQKIIELMKNYPEITQAELVTKAVTGK